MDEPTQVVVRELLEAAAAADRAIGAAQRVLTRLVEARERLDEASEGVEALMDD